MLSDAGFYAICDALGLSIFSREHLQQVRHSPASRRVGNSFAGNVIAKFASKKMQRVVEAESHKVELPAIYQMELDNNVLEYYIQPNKIKFSYVSKTGRKIAYWGTPDFLVICKDRIEWVEVKPEEALREMAEKRPCLITKDSEGNWRCPPGEEYAKTFGFGYRVFSSKEISITFTMNVEFIFDYLRDGTPPVSTEIAEKIKTIVQESLNVPLIELLNYGKGIKADHIYTMIAQGDLFVDLYAVPFSLPEKVLVFHNEDSFKACTLAQDSRITDCLVKIAPYVVPSPGNAVDWDGVIYEIQNIGNSKISLKRKNGEHRVDGLEIDIFEELVIKGTIKALNSSTPSQDIAKEYLSKARQDDLKEANRRNQIIRDFKNRQETGIPGRTIRRWINNFNKAEALWGKGYLGLLPETKMRGNRNPKLCDEVNKLMQHFVENKYEDIKQKSKKAVYREFVSECFNKGLTEPAYKTFSSAIRNRPIEEQTRKRKGNRAAYGLSQFYWSIEQTTPRHGVRPFEIGHIDHTLCDIELVDSETGENLGRPWLTLLIDAFSRRVLAATLTFDEPSYRSCMMIIRECVRRHNRLPQTIIVDNGKEFQSVYFESVVAMFECTLKSRPPAKSRFGSVCERFFGTTNTQFINNLLGNTQITKNVRQVTKVVNPKNNACWTLEQFEMMLHRFCYEVYDTNWHSTILSTPQETFARGLQLGGARAHRIIPFDEFFKLLTLPSTKSGTAKVDQSRGVKINSIYYWHEDFRIPKLNNRQIPVRFNPFNMGEAYAYINNRWVKCISEYCSVFFEMTEKEIRIATQNLKAKMGQKSKHEKINGKKLVLFILDAEKQESHLVQRKKDREVLASSKVTSTDILNVGPPLKLVVSNNLEDSDIISDADEDFLELLGDLYAAE